MDRTEQTVHHMLAAIEAPLTMSAFSAAAACCPDSIAIPTSAVLDRLSLLRYRNARRSHIYLRPSGEHRYTVLDDPDQAKLVRLSADRIEPCAVVETSRRSFQAWLKHTTVLPKLLGTFAAQTLAARYGADPRRPTGWIALTSTRSARNA